MDARHCSCRPRWHYIQSQIERIDWSQSQLLLVSAMVCRSSCSRLAVIAKLGSVWYLWICFGLSGISGSWAASMRLSGIFHVLWSVWYLWIVGSFSMRLSGIFGSGILGSWAASWSVLVSWDSSAVSLGARCGHVNRPGFGIATLPTSYGDT